jgi:hypothetical protein
MSAPSHTDGTTPQTDGATLQGGAKLAVNGLDAHPPAAGDPQVSFKRPERGE